MFVSSHFMASDSSTAVKHLPRNPKIAGSSPNAPLCNGREKWQNKLIFNSIVSNGKESTVNRALGGSTYPG